MPTPTCADTIILTSLAPSPIASVVICYSVSSGLFLTIITISAFCFGETLHASTTLELFAKLRNSYRILSFLEAVIFVNYSPPITTAISLVRPIDSYYFE
jgi:hypothetical protein